MPASEVREVAYFILNNKLYIQLESIANVTRKDFYEYDLVGNTWTQKSDFPFSSAATVKQGFSINTKGYFLFGHDAALGTLSKQLFEYNPDNDTWTMSSDFPGEPRDFMTYYQSGSDVVIGAGRTSSGGAVNKLFNDQWKFSQTTGTWTQLEDLPGTARTLSSLFELNGKTYYGLGRGTDGDASDFWSKDVTASNWNQHDQFFDSENPMWMLYPTVVVGNKAYVHEAARRAIWEFTPSTN